MSIEISVMIMFVVFVIGLVLVMYYRTSRAKKDEREAKEIEKLGDMRSELIYWKNYSRENAEEMFYEKVKGEYNESAKEKILSLLTNNPMTVNEIAKEIEITYSKANALVRILYEDGKVKYFEDYYYANA